MERPTKFDPSDQNVHLLQVWASLLLYRQILDEIEANDYNNFTRRAYVSKAKKLLALPIAYTKSVIRPSRTSTYSTRAQKTDSLTSKV